MRVATSPHDFKFMVAASANPDEGPENGEPEEDAPLATLSAPPPGA